MKIKARSVPSQRRPPLTCEGKRGKERQQKERKIKRNIEPQNYKTKTTLRYNIGQTYVIVVQHPGRTNVLKHTLLLRYLG